MRVTRVRGRRPFDYRIARSRSERAALACVLLGVLGACGGSQPEGPTPSAHRYVVASTYDAVATLALDTTSGALSTVSRVPLPASLGALSLAVAPGGEAVWLGGCGGGGGLVSLRVDRASGVLSGATLAAAGTCFPRLVAHPAGRLLLGLAAHGNELRSYRLDPATGAVVEPAASTVAVAAGTALAVDPSGRVVYVAESAVPTGVSAFAIDATSGLLTRVAGTPAALPARDALPRAALVTADAAFLLVATAQFSATPVGVVWRLALDPATGRPMVSTTPAGTSGDLVLADAAARGRFVYGPLAPAFDHTPVSARGPGSVAGFALDGVGGLTPVPGSPFVGGIAPGAVAVDAQDGFVLVGNAFARDPRSGATGASVCVYAADAGTGRLGEVTGSPFFVAAWTVNALAFLP